MSKHTEQFEVNYSLERVLAATKAFCQTSGVKITGQGNNRISVDCGYNGASWPVAIDISVLPTINSAGKTQVKLDGRCFGFGWGQVENTVNHFKENIIILLKESEQNGVFSTPSSEQKSTDGSSSAGQVISDILDNFF